jgi:hypothetical protein
VTAISHVLSITTIIDILMHALHLHGVRHLNVDAAGAHRAWIETHHWMIVIRWKG